MLLIVLIGYICALLVPVIAKALGRSHGYLIALVPLGVFVYLSTYFNRIVEGEVISRQYNWVPSLDVNFTFQLDGLSLFFGLLISFFGFLIFVYAAAYMKGYKESDKFFMYLLIFMASMLGLVMSSNLIALFIFWELTSFSSYLLIGFSHNAKTSRNAALQAFLVTASGGLALLAGFIILGEVTQTYELVEILSIHERVIDHPYYLAIVILILLGAFTKSAQFPFHFWLPNAMAAPTPVSAYLHSATMVKAGIYLIARFNPTLGGTEIWQFTLMIAGGITMLLGAILAIQHTDLKKILAYTTISALGILVLMLGAGTSLAIQSAMVFLLAHALYKGALFLITGNIDKQTGSRDVLELSGLYKFMPFTGVAAFLACFSMAGVLPFFGFIGKELIYEAALHATVQHIALLVAVIVSGVAFVAIAIEIGYGLFIQNISFSERNYKEAPVAMLVAPVTLAVLGLVFGLFAGVLVQPLLTQVSNVVGNEDLPLELHFWHGFNLVLMLSLLTLLLGTALFFVRKGIRKIPLHLDYLYNHGPTAWYDGLLQLIKRFARLQTSYFQNGYLRNYIAVIVAFFSFMLASVLWQFDLKIFPVANFDIDNVRFYEVIILAFTLVAVFVFFKTRSRLTSIVTMGVVGYAVAIIFIFFGAPDVAITQFLIETLTVVLFVLILHKLPPLRFYPLKSFQNGLYIIISIGFGLLMTSVLLLVTEHPMVSGLKAYFAENTYILGKGKNAVNVILVDFRALDTMGEISVLAIAAIGIVALLKLKLVKGKMK